MRVILAAFRRLGGGLGTACLAIGVLILLPLTAPVWRLRTVHWVARRERTRLGIIEPAEAPETTRRELTWLPVHAAGGFLLGLIGVLLPIYAVRDFSFPLWWQLLPDGEATASIGWWVIHDWPGAFGVAGLGLVWTALSFLTPRMAGWQADPGRRLLSPGPETDLSLRVAELTATRAAALDAHATELRRIERALHDGTQNRLVATTVLLGAARRALTTDPGTADSLLLRAQDAAELALSELRAVARGILPPVLADRGLAGALAGLATACPVPCDVDVEFAGRCAASVEATAYFVVAEALTNIAKHSQAGQAAIRVRRAGDRLTIRVSDDGTGGAAAGGGSGLDGIRRRVEAHDGTMTLDSPPGGPTVLEVRLPCGS